MDKSVITVNQNLPAEVLKNIKNFLCRGKSSNDLEFREKKVACLIWSQLLRTERAQRAECAT